MARKLNIMYTCMCCGKNFYYADGDEITFQEFLENDIVNPNYRTEHENGFCVDCVAAIHFKE